MGNDAQVSLANLNMVSVAEVAHRFGFAELSHFVEIYGATFGEDPSATLQRSPGMRLAAP